MADKICSQFWGYQNIPVPVVAIGTNIIFTTGKIVNAPVHCALIGDSSDSNPRLCGGESERPPYWKVRIQRHQLVSLINIPFTNFISWMYRPRHEDSMLGRSSNIIHHDKYDADWNFVYLYAKVMCRDCMARWWPNSVWGCICWVTTV